MIKTNLLWVEDEAEGGLVTRKNYLQGCGLYHLKIVRDASHAENIILNEMHDKIIFDIRIPPGTEELWESRHNAGDYRLGLVLIERVYPKLIEKKIPFGLCTVERWEDISDKILHFAPNFNPERSFINKKDIIWPDDFADFIESLKL